MDNRQVLLGGDPEAILPWRDDLLDTRVQFHFFKFGRSELTGFVEDVFRYRKFAHVMQQRGSLNQVLQTFVLSQT